MKTRQLFILAAFLTFSGISLAQNVKEMYPEFGSSLKFDPKIGEKQEKAFEILETVDYDFSKLTAENKKVLKKIGYDYENEMEDGGYYDVLSPGCSWYCGGGQDSVTASSYLMSKDTTINYLPENAGDLSFKTAWIEGVKGYGIGEYLTYHFRPSSPRITRIIVANGYVKSEKAYRENSRVKKLKLYIYNKPFAILNLKDTLCEQIFDFKPIGQRSDKNTNWEKIEKEEMPEWTMKFEILEVYPGDKYDDTAISEIYFDGIDVHCFAKGTKILMANNSLKNIELIQEGDIVKSYDFENKKLIDAKVTKLISVTHSNLLKLKFADNEIVTTADHPFWINKNVWAAVDAEKANRNYFHKTKVSNLKVGDKIFIPEKNIFSEIMDIENIGRRQNTYTIELSESNNFIANGMLVKTENVK